MSPSVAIGRSPIATVNPYSNEVVREFAPMPDAAVDRAVGAAHEAFASWRDAPVKVRAAVVAEAARLMRERSEDLAGLVTLEMGKLIGHSRSELDLAARILDHDAERGPAQLTEEPLDCDGGTAVVLHTPLGVVLGVQPWNFPFHQAVRFAGPNLVLATPSCSSTPAARRSAPLPWKRSSPTRGRLPGSPRTCSCRPARSSGSSAAPSCEEPH